VLSQLLTESRFEFIPGDQKSFMLSFDERMQKIGYAFGENIGSGFCWGKYMMIYRKFNSKSEKVYARIYIREPKIVLRLFLNNIDNHRQFIENSVPFIKEVFTGSHAQCQHCHNEKNGVCRFRKSYTLDGRFYEKCNGITFEFHDPTLEKLPNYLRLFCEFYSPNKSKSINVE
jgi:hypothetical protein